MNVLWRKLLNMRHTDATYALNRWQHFFACDDAMAALSSYTESVPDQHYFVVGWLK